MDGVTPDEASSSGGELQSLVRGIRILDLFVDTDTDECRVDQVIEYLGVPSSTAYRLVRVLKLNGLLEEGTGRGTFRLGTKLRVLGERVRSDGGLLARLRPLLEALAQETGETVLYTLRRGDEVMHAEVIESPQELRFAIPRGRRMHIALGGSGRAILAYLRPRDVERALSRPLPAYTAHTITDPAVIRHALEEVRRLGYAVTESQTYSETKGVSMPLLNRQGQPLAAISVIGPSTRMTAERLTHCLDALRRVIARVPT